MYNILVLLGLDHKGMLSKYNVKGFNHTNQDSNQATICHCAMGFKNRTCGLKDQLHQHQVQVLKLFNKGMDIIKYFVLNDHIMGHFYLSRSWTSPSSYDIKNHQGWVQGPSFQV
jgi:hypothetical protein